MFRCKRCGNYFDSMLGNICNGCSHAAAEHNELIEALKRERKGEGCAWQLGQENQGLRRQIKELENTIRELKGWEK